MTKPETPELDKQLAATRGESMSLRDMLPPEKIEAARQRYFIDRATEVVDRHVDPRVGNGRDIVEALVAEGLIRDIDVHVEATTTGKRCTVKRLGVTVFEGVSLEATLTTEAHDRRVAERTLREAAAVFANFAAAALTDLSRVGWERARDALLGMADEAGERGCAREAEREAANVKEDDDARS